MFANSHIKNSLCWNIISNPNNLKEPALNYVHAVEKIVQLIVCSNTKIIIPTGLENIRFSAKLWKSTCKAESFYIKWDEVFYLKASYTLNFDFDSYETLHSGKKWMEKVPLASLNSRKACSASWLGFLWHTISAEAAGTIEGKEGNSTRRTWSMPSIISKKGEVPKSSLLRELSKTGCYSHGQPESLHWYLRMAPRKVERYFLGSEPYNVGVYSHPYLPTCTRLFYRLTDRYSVFQTVILAEWWDCFWNLLNVISTFIFVPEGGKILNEISYRACWDIFETEWDHYCIYYGPLFVFEAFLLMIIEEFEEEKEAIFFSSYYTVLLSLFIFIYTLVGFQVG